MWFFVDFLFVWHKVDLRQFSDFNSWYVPCCHCKPSIWMCHYSSEFRSLEEWHLSLTFNLCFFSSWWLSRVFCILVQRNLASHAHQIQQNWMEINRWSVHSTLFQRQKKCIHFWGYRSVKERQKATWLKLCCPIADKMLVETGKSHRSMGNSTSWTTYHSSDSFIYTSCGRLTWMYLGTSRREWYGSLLPWSLLCRKKSRLL